MEYHKGVHPEVGAPKYSIKGAQYTGSVDRPTSGFESLQAGVSYLHDRIDLLTQRLEPVLQAGDPGPPTSQPSSASALGAASDSVQIAGLRIDSLVNRLDL